jgi:hypothetical protein
MTLEFVICDSSYCKELLIVFTHQLVLYLLFPGLVVSNSASGSASGSGLTMGDGGSLQFVVHAQRGSATVQQSLRQELLRNSSSSDLLHHDVDDRVSVTVE